MLLSHSYLNPFPNKPWVFLSVCSTRCLKTLWEKEKLLVLSNFFFSLRVFCPFWRTFCHFNQIWSCRLQTLSVWKSLKCVVWERINRSIHQYNFIRFQICLNLERAEPHSSVGSVADLRTGGRWFNPRLGQYSFRGLMMIVIATGFISLSPQSVVSKMIIWLGIYICVVLFKLQNSRNA